MTEPELFGRPAAGGPAAWPPKAMPTSSVLANLEAPSQRRVNYDWKFFTLAAVAVAMVVVALFAAMSLGR